MSSFLFASKSIRVWRRPHVGIAAVVVIVATFGWPRPRRAALSFVVPGSVCAAEPEPPPPPAPRPAPTVDGYRDLAACLQRRNDQADQGAVIRGGHVTVDQVRTWVEIDGDPAWPESDGAGSRWWFPLSGEGEPDYPSGAYVIVGHDAPSGLLICGGAIVN
jgi:hypothetical protein